MQIKVKPVKCAKCSDGKNYVCAKCYKALENKFEDRTFTAMVFKNYIVRLERQLEEIRGQLSDFWKMEAKTEKEHIHKWCGCLDKEGNKYCWCGYKMDGK